MDKRTAARVRPLFSGLVSRMRDNSEYFKGITIEFKSGTKVFPGLVTLENGDIYIDYQAVKQKLSDDGLVELVCEETAKYDELRIEYTERGAKIVIKGDRKNVRMTHEDVSTAEVEQQKTASIGGRNYVVNPALASELLREIGILAKNGKIKNDKIRKYNQIDYFVELMSKLLEETDDEELLILDCACGKSYLSFVLNFYLREILKKKCRFIGVDYSPVVIDASIKTAKRLGYQNMEFVRADLNSYSPPKTPTAVISLHACDTATDMAIGLGIRTGAKTIVAVPCCHKDILKQYSYEPFSAVTKHGVLKARLADTLTDGLRASYLEGRGYKVSLIEYISPLETPKNIMIRAVKTSAHNTAAMEEYEKLKRLINVSPAIERFSGKSAIKDKPIPESCGLIYKGHSLGTEK